MDKVLGGDGVLEETFAEKVDAGSYTGKRERGFADLTRFTPQALPLEQRLNSFNEVELCFSDEQAVSEAKRCLQCDFEVKLAKRLGLKNP
jgi:hypothetical protein